LVVKLDCLFKYCFIKIYTSLQCNTNCNKQGGAKTTHVFQTIVTLLICNIKKIMLTPKQPVINAVLINYSDYSITENYRVAQKEGIKFLRCPLAPTLTRCICLRFLSLGVTSNQKSAFENLVQSTIWKFPPAMKLQLFHKKCKQMWCRTLRRGSGRVYGKKDAIFPI